MDWVLQNITDEIAVLSGSDKGTETLGEKYAVERGYSIILNEPDWKKYGKKAAYIMRKRQIELANACVCFWDGKNKGTKFMIDLANKHKLKLKIFKYK